MPFQLSAGVNVTEIDLTTIIPAVATTDAAIGGVFQWGPVEKPLMVSDQDKLVQYYGKPNNNNGETFFTAASFLAYSNRMYVSRASHTAGRANTFTADVTSGSTALDLASADLTLEVGDAVYGDGIPEGTVIASITDAANGIYVMSEQATATSATAHVQIFEADYCFNAFANTNTANLNSQIVKNEDHYETAELGFDDDVQWVAKYPGALGNSLKISVCDAASVFNSTLNILNVDSANTDQTLSGFQFTVGSNTATITVSNTATGDANSSAAVAESIAGDITIGDIIRTGNTEIGYEYLKVTAKTPVTKVDSGGETGEATIDIQFDDRYSLSTDILLGSFERNWEYYDVVDQAPGQTNYQIANGNTAAQDEMHIAVIDEDGKITGIPGQILEIFEGVSRATDCKTEDGGTNYYKEVINQNSKWVWYAGDYSGALSNTADLLESSTNTSAHSYSFVGGRDTLAEDSISLADLIRSYDHFKSAEDIDISLIMVGKARGGVHGEQLANYLIDNIATKRMDCVVFCSPDKADVVDNNGGDIEQDVVQFRNACRSTSYGVLDSGYKYQYDKYNDVYRWIPLNGDTAGLCAHTDNTRDPWWSPAGFNRGHIKNVIKLAWNPKKAQRDILYKNGVNPVVNFPGEGIVLYGDKTLLAKPSAFDRINVRRLFIVLEKAIATAAKYTLFEFNDAFTRASFVNLVTPFLRDVQGRRGIYDFTVVCDESNNTGEVIDRNEFVGDIYIKPARSINFINLNFVAVRTGVEFSEVIGRF